MPSASTLQLALPVPLPQLFDYSPPEGHAPQSGDIGRRLRVPFGRRELVGIVTAIGSNSGQQELRPALDFLDAEPLLHGELWQSLQWLAGYLHAPLGEVLATALPTALRQGEPLPDTALYGWYLSDSGEQALAQMRQGRPRQLAEYLAAHPGISESLLDAQQPGWRTAMRTLEKRGQVERRIMAAPTSSTPANRRILNAEQQSAADAICQAEGFQPFLLDGITGSGKTEVYLEAIAACLAREQQALVLVPEIGLTPQMLARFQHRLGVEVHALHSGLSDTERARVWAAAWRGQAQVIVGTRSSVFVPLPKAGLIVVDEEHDSSYKQFDGIRYHARDFALVRAKALNIPVVLGSATPSLETLANARQGRFHRLRLSQRAANANPPAVQVMDIRKRPLQAGLSPEALQAIKDALSAGGQVLVFKNRRGYAPSLLCHDCGWSAHCPRCSTDTHGSAMTVHGHGRRLQCHHCGQHRPSPPACPACGGLALQPQGNGTERIEAYLAEKFADFPVIRIDKGSTQGRNALQKHFDTLGNQPGILVGTQMLAKGHDLPNLTLVVVVGIDEGLYSADFRSPEKLAQLLIQVAGRAGRASKGGQVLLQTHHPEHWLLQTLIGGGYHAFAEGALSEREATGFPPFSYLALLRAEGREADVALAFLQQARKLLEAGLGRPALPFHGASSALGLSGPAPAPHPRRAGYQRAQLLISAAQRKPLHQALRAVIPLLYALPEARKVRWSLDIDPLDLH
ncbi:primosomal protein N' [Lysobacteraceae bacterium NML95-0200]|nr:primosomal protein N' [Xanthomonadaceae bacterium NML95-0200]